MWDLMTFGSGSPLGSPAHWVALHFTTIYNFLMSRPVHTIIFATVRLAVVLTDEQISRWKRTYQKKTNKQASKSTDNLGISTKPTSTNNMPDVCINSDDATNWSIYDDDYNKTLDPFGRSREAGRFSSDSALMCEADRIPCTWKLLQSVRRMEIVNTRNSWERSKP